MDDFDDFGHTTDPDGIDGTRWPKLKAMYQYLTGTPAPGEDEDLTLGFSMLRALAEHDETMVEVEPGVWRASKRPDEREL